MIARDRFDRWFTAKIEGYGPVKRAWWWCGEHGQLLWLWRPACRLRGYHVPHHCDLRFENCVWRWKPLWSRSRDGEPNPFVNPVVDRAPLRRSKALAGRKAGGAS